MPGPHKFSLDDIQAFEVAREGGSHDQLVGVESGEFEFGLGGFEASVGQVERGAIPPALGNLLLNLCRLVECRGPLQDQLSAGIVKTDDLGFVADCGAGGGGDDPHNAIDGGDQFDRAIG